MKKQTTIRAGALLSLLLLVTNVTARADVLFGTVVGVSDGDTITVLDANREQHKVRVAGIDAPDMQVPSRKS